MESTADNWIVLAKLILLFLAFSIALLAVAALIEYIRDLILELLDKTLVLLLTPVFWVFFQVARPFLWLFLQIATPFIVLYFWGQMKLFELKMKLFWRKKPGKKRQEKQQPHEEHTHQKSHARQESHDHKTKRENASQNNPNKKTTGDIRVDTALALLGLPINNNFGMKELNVQFREMVKDCHPDRSHGDVELMQEINKARDIIKKWRNW